MATIDNCKFIIIHTCIHGFLHPFCRITPLLLHGSLFSFLFLSFVSIIVTGQWSLWSLRSNASCHYQCPDAASCQHPMIKSKSTSARQTNGRNTSRNPKKKFYNSVGFPALSQQPTSWYECIKNCDNWHWLNNRNQKMNNNTKRNY